MDPNIINKTAQLAQLELTEKELDSLHKDLSGIFELFDVLDNESIKQLQPLGHPLEETQRLREDIVIPRNLSDSIQKNAPLSEDDFITVPKVIE